MEAPTLCRLWLLILWKRLVYMWYLLWVCHFFFVEKRCWVVVLNAQFSFSCKLCVSGRLGCHPTFVNLGGLILFCPFKKFHKNYAWVRKSICSRIVLTQFAFVVYVCILLLVAFLVCLQNNEGNNVPRRSNGYSNLRRDICKTYGDHNFTSK